jgi:formylglycine-generating enzyme required for sulfatase activity
MTALALLLTLLVPDSAMVRIGGGSFRPLYAQPGERTVSVAPFLLDARPVTRADFEAFLRLQPRWQRGRAPRLFVDEHYLRDWAGPADAGTSRDRALPVTDVSWFAARSYCEARGARLPTVAEWEYAARADERERDAAARPSFRQRALELASGRRIQAVGSGFTNVWGASDLHGNALEWVYDFASVFAGTDSRQTSRLDRGLTCASGVTHTGDPGDYAAYLRYALRGTLQARSTTGTLGFRCARSLS